MYINGGRDHRPHRKGFDFMFITKKRYEKELEEARASGFNQAMERRNTDDQFRFIHERLDRLAENFDRLAEKINQPKPIGFEMGERKC